MRRFFAIILSAAMLVIVMLPGTVYASPGKTLKIGYIDYQGFIQQNEDGTYEGYGVDYLNEISKYTGWKYEYVFGTWPDLMKKLKNKEIDFLCSAQKVEERKADFDFSEYSIGYTQGLLYTLPENDSIYYEDYKALDNKKIGGLRSSATNKFLEKYAKHWGFRYKLIEYDSEAELVAALKAGEVETIATDRFAYHNDLKLVAQFGADAYYMMSYKGSPYMEEANYALSEIKINYSFETNLFEKYYSESTEEKGLLYTREEVEYIKSAPVITVGNLPDKYPVSRINPETGKVEGLNEDILDLISQISGLKFEQKAIPLGEKPIKALKEGKFDLVAGVVRTDEFEKDPAISLSNPFLTSDLVAVVRNGYGYNLQSNMVLAVDEAFQAVQDYVAKTYPDAQIVTYKKVEDALKAVCDGDADVVVQNAYVVSYLLQKPRYESLQILPTHFMEENSSIVGLSSADPRLISVINKTIGAIGDEKINEMVTAKTIANPYHATLSDIIYEYRVLLSALGALIIIVFMASIVVWRMRQKNLLRLQAKNLQLAEAVKRADMASQAKSQFLARMSHEIRTPMNAIVGLTTIAKSYKDSAEKMEEYLNKIMTASKVLLGIINDILDMSAIENEKLKIGKIPFDFKQLLTDISSMYYGQCKEKGIKFDLILSEVSEETLVGDALRTNQVLLNLMSNAFKFTPPGGSIRFQVTQTLVQDGVVHMRFEISDTGVGMTKEMQERLFQPFEQESEITAIKHGGSGLGMSITKSLVDIMHGKIEVHSEKEQGTTFIVELPFGLSEESSGMKEDVKGIRALVVDDDRDAREYTSNILNHLSISHDLATSGEEAIEKISRESEKGRGYDVCFIDWVMDGIDGIGVTRKIRELFDENTIIIIVSAYDLSEVEEEARKAGANMFITKPIFQSTVFDLLMTLSCGKYKGLMAQPDEYDFTGHRVLVAEDNAMNMEIIVDLLKLVNMEVDCAEDGEKALEMFEKSAPGTYMALLLDIQMPIMDGHEATRAIRMGSHPDAKTIPIYAITANAFTEDVSAALAAGMDGYIAKPIDNRVLYSTLAKHCKEVLK
ncbi:MAG: transporter substrate-binding domain-containing protein [Muricomes sp.]